MAELLDYLPRKREKNDMARKIVIVALPDTAGALRDFYRLITR